jgi:phospholipid/cholesterol/gamma-HCH transport system substrate-binding protein
MNRPYKFRYANEIAGGFVLFGVLLLILGIYSAGHAQGWFQKHLILRARFNTTEGTYGLQEGAEIRILGALAGRVGEISPAPDGGMETKFILKGRFGGFVRNDSIAKVKKKFQIAGDSYVDITLGSSHQPLMESGSFITCEQDVELIETARKLMDDFREAAVPMLDEFRQILSHVNGITRQLEQKEGAAGKLIGDPEWAGDVDTIIKDIRLTAAQLPGMAARLEIVMTNVQSVAESLKATAGKFPAIGDAVAGTVQDARMVTGGLTGQVANVQGVLLQAESALRETQTLIEGLQRHWLVRRYIPQEEATPMLEPLSTSTRDGGAP